MNHSNRDLPIYRSLPLLMIMMLVFSNSVWAAKKKSTPTASPTGNSSASAPAEESIADTAGEAIDVSKVSEKYWAQGKESELGVVQNRKYNNDGRLELGVFGGLISSDPFLKVNHFGGRIGYHLNSIWSFYALGWTTKVKGSDAFIKYNEVADAPKISTNEPRSFIGGEVDTNLLYGKLSVLGSMIIYVDVFLLGGAGVTKTETGSYFTPFIGLGQKIFLSQHFSLQLDYRIMQYNETIKSKVAANAGTVLGTRSNTTDAISLGLSFIL
jgi:outer membrane beta-barrel protein